MPKPIKVETTSPSTFSKQPPSTQIPDNNAAKITPPPMPFEVEDTTPREVVEENIEVSPPALTYINDRIFEYGRKLERWKKLDAESVKKRLKDEEAAEMVRCFRELQSVLNGYNDLRGRLLQIKKASTAEKMGNAAILELEKNDITFLESSCGKMLADSPGQGAGWSKREEGADLSQLEILIDRYSASKEYEEVIQTWQKIPAPQVNRVHLRTKVHYGNALMYLHQEEKAAEIYQQVVDQMSESEEQATDIVSLRKVLADLYTASGNYKAAAIQYKKISDDYQNIGKMEEWSKLQLSILDRSAESGPELKEYSALLRNFLGFNASQDGFKVVWQAEKFLSKYPYSPVATNVELIKTKVKMSADKWFEGFMSGVDKLRGEKRFKEAQGLLNTLPPDIISPEKQIALKGKGQELVITESVEKETERMALIQDLQNKWNNGLLLTKAEKFDEALTIFKNLVNTEYGTKAEEKIREVSLEAAKAERKKAANLYMRFSKTTDQESKKKLLIESHKVLKNILVKYPDVDIKPKVLGNLERVEQDMMAIDPKLLITLDQEDVSSAQNDGLERTFAVPDNKDQKSTGEVTRQPPMRQKWPPSLPPSQ